MHENGLSEHDTIKWFVIDWRSFQIKGFSKYLVVIIGYKKYGQKWERTNEETLSEPKSPELVVLFLISLVYYSLF